jgi:RNA polymerase sigma-B factor
MPHTTLPSRSRQSQTPSAEELLRKAQHSSRSTAARLRHEVVLDHLALATSIARRYDHRGLERQDLEQVALLGLVQAVRRYNPEFGSGFVAFAVPTITGELKRYFRDHGWAVRPPRQLQEQSLAVRSCVDRLAQDLGREPECAEVAASLGLSAREVEQARAVDGQYIARSMDAPVDYDSGASLADTLGEPAVELDRVEDFETLRPLLTTLKARERLILRLRFVDNLTQRQIGQQIGVSQMQVSRLLSDILLRLRQAMSMDEASAAS